MRSRVQRLPGLPSSHALYESMRGELDDFGLESYVGNPAEREVPGPDLHAQMEHRAGIASGPPTSRHFF